MHRLPRPGFVLALAGAALFAMGCGSDDDPPTSSAQSSSGAGAQGGSGAEGGAGGSGAGSNGGGGAAPAGTLEVLVLDDTAAAAPVADVPCALVAPGGEVIDGTTGADGRIAFEGLDWTLGKAAATCLFEFSGQSLVEIDEAWLQGRRGEVKFVRPGLLEPIEYVEASGTVLNPVDANHTFLVSSGISFYQDFGPAYEVPVRKGVPFDLVATEFTVVQNPAPHGFGQDFFGWAAVHSEAVDANVVIDIDKGGADALEPEQVEASVLLPPSPQSIFRGQSGYGAVYVTPADSRYFTLLAGFSTRTQYAAGDTRLAYTAEFVDSVVPAEEIVTVHLLMEGGDATDGVSYWLVPGYPTAGDVAEPFLDAPRVVEPPSSGSPLVGAVMQWDEEGEPPTMLQITGPDYAWYVRSADGAATSITVPALPSSVNPFDLFGGSVLAALAAEGPMLPTVYFYEQLALSHAVTLSP